ncbi:methionyl-tRNA formyltransferase [Helicobacter sp. 11S02596-1]|uniref:methionyl-tRNA formyltransferase n=1 Tax=Helicobacter sp. 11S02596-1 TaxID=1476194 RepID=UPI000BA54269|nr:methionyl-tRNA formyltransferase [Helicobacter sp. 11S02596-1]PAF44223.1 methionyl-tRNA formyltransferase [Helicobacter sp. 11S02596-1]
MRILFMGTPYFAQVILEKILEDSHFEVVGLFAQPDRPFGRKQELKSPATKEYVIQKNIPIPIFQPQNLDEESFGVIAKLKPDAIVVVAYGKILPKQILASAKCLNIHASVLPNYRGASPIHEMILNDDKIYGVSVIAMEAGLDSGDILGVSAFEREKPLGLEALLPILAEMGGALAIKVLKNLKIIQPLKQRHADATYCKKIIKNQGLVDFENAKEIYLKFLAYSTWPQIFLPSGLKLFGIELVCQTEEYQKGEILSVQKDSIVVGCLRGTLRIGALQSPGKQKMDAKTYIQGKRLKIGDVLA